MSLSFDSSGISSQFQLYAVPSHCFVIVGYMLGVPLLCTLVIAEGTFRLIQRQESNDFIHMAMLQAYQYQLAPPRTHQYQWLTVDTALLVVCALLAYSALQSYQVT